MLVLLRRARTRAAVLILATVLGLGAVIPAGATVPDPTPSDPAPSGPADPAPGFRLGAHVDRGTAASAAEAVAAFEDALGRRLDVHRWYSRWDDAQPVAPVVESVQRGRTPLLSIWPKRLDGSVVTWAQIASGAVDADIRRQAAGIATLGVPVYLTLHHEPDLAQGWGTPAEYRAAWRHYVEVFRAAGVPDVRWTWIVTPGSFGSAPSTAGADAFYPGDDVVDRVGLDAYNWFGCAPGKPTSWRPLSEVVGPFRRWAAAHGLTPLLAEVGTAADPADAGRAGAWWTQAFGYLGGWDGLDVVSTFEGTGTCPWAVAGTPTTRAALAAAAAGPVAHAVPSASLLADVTVGAAPLTVRLDPGRSTGGGSATGQGVASWTLDLGDGTVLTGTVLTGTGRPTAVTHTYAAGERTARLTVTDAAGRTAVDTVRLVAAAPATVTGAERDVTSTSVGLRAWVDPHGVAGRLRIAWGAEGAGAAEIGAVEVDVPAGTAAQAFAQQVTGLTPGTRYRWTATVTTAAGSSTLTRTVDTPGPPTVRALAATGAGRTAATVPLRVHPRSLDTVVRVEWRPEGSVGAWSRSTDVAMAAATWERAGTVTVTGLAPGSRYRFRVIAGNALGTTTGVEQTLSTAP
jgi:hypothetical protein